MPCSGAAHGHLAQRDTSQGAAVLAGAESNRPPVRAFEDCHVEAASGQVRRRPASCRTGREPPSHLVQDTEEFVRPLPCTICRYRTSSSATTTPTTRSFAELSLRQTLPDAALALGVLSEPESLRDIGCQDLEVLIAPAYEVPCCADGAITRPEIKHRFAGVVG